MNTKKCSYGTIAKNIYLYTYNFKRTANVRHSNEIPY